MAISCDPSTLANAATCFSSCIPVGEEAAVQSYLLAQIALALGAISSADPSTLANAARCFSSCGADTLAVQNYLLCQINNK